MKKNIIANFSNETGGITSIVCTEDKDKMNWCESTSDFGLIKGASVSGIEVSEHGILLQNLM